ncbi:MAG: RHS repeat domain-containing protein [Acidobacteriota bacterium]
MRQLVMSGYSATYGYDARDERVAWVDSTEGGIHYTLRGLSNEILREVHELSGVWTWRKDYIFAGTTHIATVDSSGLTHVHKDHLGSTRVITNASGAKISEHRYWPFGEEMTVTSSPERMRFAGHERDMVTNLDYMHARYYAPFGGRFLSVDPGRDFDPAHPQRWNLYAYVRNNPVTMTDPAGREVYLYNRPVQDFPLARHVFLVVRLTGENKKPFGNRAVKGEFLIVSGMPGVSPGVKGQALVRWYTDSLESATHRIVIQSRSQSRQQFEKNVLDAFGKYQNDQHYNAQDVGGKNSNSLVSGILDAAGAKEAKPSSSELEGWVPGWNDPVKLPDVTKNDGTEEEMKELVKITSEYPPNQSP